MSIRICGWERFQHYGKRNPPWIKLYRDLLGDYEFGALNPSEKWSLIGLWLLAASTGNEIPNDEKWLKRQLGVVPPLSKLETLGFIEVGDSASAALAERYSKKSRVEKRRDMSNEGVVFSYWEEARFRTVKPKRRVAQKRTAVRMSKIGARLSDGYTPDDLKGAVDGCMASKHHRDGGYLDIELICRDQKHVEMFLQLATGRPSNLRRL